MKRWCVPVKTMYFSCALTVAGHNEDENQSDGGLLQSPVPEQKLHQRSELDAVASYARPKEEQYILKFINITLSDITSL